MIYKGMSPIDKAKEIIDEIYRAKPGTSYVMIDKEHSIILALISVNQIINCDSFFNTLENSKIFISYWFEVQKELKNMKL